MKTVSVKNIILGSGRTKIVTPVVSKKGNDILEDVKRLIHLECDLVEWRVDFFEEVTNFLAVAQLSKKIASLLEDKPLLITFRTKKEGGEIAFSDNQYFELYRTILLEGKLDLLDVELFMEVKRTDEIIKLAHKRQVNVLMCNHEFTRTPPKSEIISRLINMQNRNADICKIAVMPQTTEDVLTLLSATNEMKKQHADRPIVTISMGHLGMISRISGELFGSAMTFGAEKNISAPGQLPISKLSDLLELFSQENK